MAQLDGNNESMELFKMAPDAFRQVLIQFRVCHDLCVYTNKEILEPDTLTKVDQCAVDFRHMSIQTATLADRVSSLWCKTCLLLFKNIEKLTNPNKILTKISIQAKDLSEGFKTIGKWCRELAGRFHEAQHLATENSKEFQESVDGAEKEADRLMKELTSELDKMKLIAEQKRDTVDTLTALTVIPVFGIFFGVAAIIKNKKARSAEESEKEARKKSEEAMKELSKAQNKKEKAQKIAKEISKLVASLLDIERLCECIGAFWQIQSDRFGSFGTSVTEVQDFIEIGLGSEACQNQIEWLEETKTTLGNYHSLMSQVNSAFNYPTSLTPSHFPSIELSSIALKLE